jgi:N-acetylglutamate synthase-like GNAT family acetyltransferase
MEIRKAEIQDLNQIKKLEDDWFKEKISPYMSNDTIKEIKAGIVNNEFFVAEKDNKIIGFSKIEINKINQTMNVYGLKKNQKYIELDSVYVSKEFRKNNIGSKLVNKIKAYAKEKGIKSILLSADNSDINKLMKFYNKFGFKTHFVRMFKIIK